MVKLFVILIFSTQLQAKLITTSLKMDVTRPYEGIAVKLDGYKKKFNQQIKRIESKQYRQCLKDKVIPAKTPDRLKVWWTYIILKCARNNYKKNSIALRPIIKNHIAEMKKYKGDISYLGSDLGKLLVALAGSKTYIITETEKNFLLQIESHLKPRSQAKLYNFLASRFENKNKPKLAAQYYFKAHDVSNSQMYAMRLKTFLNSNKDLIPTYQDFYDTFEDNDKGKPAANSYSSFHSMRNSLAKVKLGIKLLNENKSTNYKVISKIYKLLRKKIDPDKFDSKWATELKKCHVKCIVKLAEKFYLSHDYKNSYVVANAAFSKESVARAKVIMGLSALQLGQHSKAEQDFSQARKASLVNSADFFESSFRLGLVHFRAKNFQQAVKVMENLEEHKKLNKYNLQTTYWLWRSLQRLERIDEANVVRNRLIKLYPLTYYGLLANFEKNDNKLILPTNIHVFQKNMKWTPKQVVSWENYKDFLQMQFYFLAKKELKILFNVENDQEAVLYSHFSSLAADHFAAIKTMNIIWNKNPYVNFTKNTTKLTLPIEYNTIVNSYSDKYDIERNLVRSLIKQESSYRLKAISSSNAMGLMQLVPITIKDSAQYLRINKTNARKTVYEPEMNVRMGTSYLNRMIRAFKGHVPLALACYNAGIGNIRRWIKKRPQDLAHLAEKGSSSVDDEIWIDELPWAETSFYVKAILRNLVLYRFYYDGVNKIPKTVWELEAPVTAKSNHFFLPRTLNL